MPASEAILDEMRVAYDSLVKTLSNTEHSRRNSMLLSRAANRLIGSLDQGTLLIRLGELFVPRFATWCSVDLLEGESLQRAHVCHSSDAPAEMRSFVESMGLDRPGPEHTKALQDGTAHVVPRTEASPSTLIAPLSVPGRNLGVITLVSGKNRDFAPDSLQSILEILQPAGYALEHVRSDRELHSALRVRDELLAIASHELKTPLTALALQITAIQHSSSHESAKRLAELANAQVDRMKQLLDELLDMTRIRAGRMTLHSSKVDLEELIHKVVRQLESMISNSGSKLSISKRDDRISGFWDPSRIEQVICNVLSNALKYGLGGPIEIEISRIETSAVLRIQDSGMGIPEDDQIRIFQPFERSRISDNHRGLGLELYISKQIVEAHQGKIIVESEPGKGSIFTIQLPLRPGHSHEH